jgi:ABC-type histidine transport system ATPase subunit
LVFQFFQLLPTLTVIENVMLPMDFAKKIPIGERRARARQLLERVGVADQADKVPATLSGDEVEVGRLAAITLQFAVGPETRELIERLAGRVAVQVELGPKTLEVIEEFIPKRESEPRAAGVQPAR